MNCLASLMLLALAVPCSAASQTWIVSDPSCPGSDFTSIQAAVDAAADGDTILVRYATSFIDRNFEVVQKSLTIVQAKSQFIAAMTQVGGDVTVRDLLPNQSVTLVGLLSSSSGKLVLKDNQGAVWIESMAYSSTPATNQPPYFEPVRIENCAAVTFVKCWWTAPDYQVQCQMGSPCIAAVGPTGTVVINSEVQFYSCTLVGGEGGPGYDPFNLGSVGGKGGPAVRLENSTVNIYGSNLRGGRGGTNSQNLPAPFCANGGDGGPAIFLADTSSQVRLQETSLSGGAGGRWTDGIPVPLGCIDGSVGVDLEGPGAANATFLPGTNRTTTIGNTVTLIEGQTASLDMTGEFGDIIFLGVGLDHDPVFQPAFNGTSVFAPLEIIRLGKIGMSGSKTIPIVPGDIVAAGESVTVFLQTYNFDTSLNLHYSEPSARIVLDSSHDPADGCQTLFLVDDDAPNDPGPNDPLVSDPLEDGTALHPFDSIQEAVTSSALTVPITVRVADGTYDVPSPLGIRLGQRMAWIESENGPDNCIVDAGAADSAFRFDDPSATPAEGVSGFTITGAVSSGVRIENSSVTIDNCVIEGNESTTFGTASSNRGGGLYLLNSTSLISNCVVRDNLALGRGGGIYALTSQPTIQNCTVEGNTAPVGAGICLDSSTNAGADPQGFVRNCTVANNFGVGLHYRTRPTFAGTNEAENLLAWGNVGGVQVEVRTGTLVLDYADVEGGAGGVLLLVNASLTTGPGFINLDPVFVDQINGDFHLSEGSPCIDAGDPSYVALPGETDIDGEARVQGAAVDLGSDEFE